MQRYCGCTRSVDCPAVPQNGTKPLQTTKRVIQCHQAARFLGAHGLTWLPQKSTHSVLWVTWLQGNVQWEGTGAPWEKVIQLCPVCYHTTAHGTRHTSAPLYMNDTSNTKCESPSFGTRGSHPGLCGKKWLRSGFGMG